jgi:hypothetical protein
LPPRLTSRSPAANGNEAHRRAAAGARLGCRSQLGLLRAARRCDGSPSADAATTGPVARAALSGRPLSIVQAASAGGIALLAALVGRLTRRERLAVVVAVIGLVLLGLSLIGTHPPTSHGHWKSVALWMGISVAVAALAAGPASAALAGGAGLGIAAGVLYAAGDVGTKAALAGGTRFAFLPALLACHGLAFVCMQLGFQRGGALATAGMATLWTNALPIAAGSILFAEALPGGLRGAARVAAFACVVLGAAALARPEPLESPAPAPVGQVD